MNSTEQIAAARQVRDTALIRADEERSNATHDAEVEFSETVSKLHERLESDLAEALAHYRVAVCPAHRAYNAATIRAERAYEDTLRRLRTLASR